MIVAIDRETSPEAKSGISLSAMSSFARTIKEHGFLPLSISKYCLGTVALKNGVKYNRFKPRLRKVDSLMAQENNNFALVV